MLFLLAELFENVTTDILVRSQKRLEETLSVHKKRLSELDQFRVEHNLAPSPRWTAISARSARSQPVLDASKRSKGIAAELGLHKT